MSGNVQENQALNSLKGKVVAIPKIDPSLTKSGEGADAKVVGENLDLMVKYSDIVNDLISDSAKAVLSGQMGIVLREMIEGLESDVELTVEAITSKLEEVDKTSKGALPMNGGGTVTGEIKVKKFDNGYGFLNKNHSATEDFGTQIVDTSNSGKTAHIDVSGELDTVTFTGNDNVSRKMLHEGNKAFGGYEGNGSATTRTINTESVGRLLLVYSSTRQALVSPKGAFVINISDGSFEWIAGAKVTYLNGILTLNTTSQALNASGTTYYYQAI